MTNIKESAKLSLAKMIGEVRMALLAVGNKSLPVKELAEIGYKVVRDGYWNTYAYKNGIGVGIDFYSSSYTYNVNHGVFYGDEDVKKYCHFTRIDEQIDDILACGFVPDYTRSLQMQAFADNIKSKIEETNKLVSARSLGEIGVFLRSRGYSVSYDGFSWCTFSKDGILYNASYDKGWKLTDRFKLYVGDDILSAEFSIRDKDRTDGLKYIELYVGTASSLGRELTEMDKLHTYSRFRVRTYNGDELATAKWFDDFEEAKKFAYELACEKARNVRPYNREWAVTDPKDRGTEFDMLACFIWYEYRNSKCLVFVQGEE